jgi:hypothetical protein
LANFGGGVLLSAFTQRNQVESQERKRMAAQWTVKVNDTMPWNLEHVSRPHQSEFFVTVGTRGDLNRESF